MNSTRTIHATRASIVLVCTATVALALAACGGASQSASPSASGANGPLTIHLRLKPTSDTYVSVGSLSGCTGSCQGDYLVGNDPLFDATTNKQVGTLVYVEFLVDPGDRLFHSPGNTITLTGRGQIVFSETLHDDQSGRAATGAILGGTDEFLGATGFVISRSTPVGGDFVITITN